MHTRRLAQETLCYNVVWVDSEGMEWIQQGIQKCGISNALDGSKMTSFISDSYPFVDLNEEHNDKKCEKKRDDVV